MEFVYHGVPAELVGGTIYPLNQLARLHPALYERQRAKYAGREAVLDAQISDDLLFNDTVHCAPLHPNRLFVARAGAGFLPTEAETERARGAGWTGLFFQIPVDRLRQHRVLWYRWETLWINGAPGEDVPHVPPVDEFVPFDFDRYHELAQVPEAHLDYLRRMRKRGRQPLLFVHIPHVLVAGPIDISGLDTVHWRDPPRVPAEHEARGSIPLRRIT